MAIRATAKLRAAVLAALAVSAMAVAGCGSSSSSSTSTAAAAPAAASASSSSSYPTTSSSTSSPSSESSSESIGTAKGSMGTYLTADEGRAVYLWVADSGGKSACAGACAKAWPPVETKGKPVAGSGVNAADLATTTRSDGSQQVTYKGHPLYYFIADKSKGETKGQGNNGFGASWWLVAPSGTAIKAGTSSGGGSSGSSSSSSSSGGWG